MARASLIAAIVVAPNILWNIDNGLATFRHTGDNIQGGGLAFDPLKGLEFVAAQFAVFGPVVFAVLLLAFVRIGSRADEPRRPADARLRDCRRWCSSPRPAS